eukprot:6204348-Pleurochrysis_carterae.AAC.1
MQRFCTCKSSILEECSKICISDLKAPSFGHVHGSASKTLHNALVFAQHGQVAHSNTRVCKVEKWYGCFGVDKKREALRRRKEAATLFGMKDFRSSILRAALRRSDDEGHARGEVMQTNPRRSAVGNVVYTLSRGAARRLASFPQLADLVMCRGSVCAELRSAPIEMLSAGSVRGVERVRSSGATLVAAEATLSG